MYLEYFGLNEEPFSMTPDPRFLFWSEQHEVATRSLLYGVEARKGFLLLTGEIGTGKTTLCRALVNRLSAETRVSVILNPLLSVSGLLKAINQDFGNRVRKKSADEQLSYLSQFLLERVQDGHNAVVLIDEAQNLSIEALETVRLLSNLETDRQKLLQIILVGQPELEQNLQSYALRQLNQRISVRCHLGALSRSDQKYYIYHRLKIAGNLGCFEFKNGSLKLIHKYTRGYPRVTNILCDRVLLAAFARRVRVIDKALVAEGIHDLTGGARRSLWGRWACRLF